MPQFFLHLKRQSKTPYKSINHIIETMKHDLAYLLQMEQSLSVFALFIFFLIAREILTSAFNLHDFPTDLEFWLKKFFIFVLVLDT